MPPMKRRDDGNHLSKEEYDSRADDDSEGAGTFQRASAEELASRKIIRASKRHSSTHDDSAPSIPSVVEPPKSANPFANISFSQPPASSAAFGKQPLAFGQPTPNTVGQPTLAFGLPPLGLPRPAVVTPSDSSSAQAASASAAAAATAAAAAIAKSKRLNRSFLAWTESQLQRNPVAIWKDGVKDYIRYATALKLQQAAEPAVASAITPVVVPPVAAELTKPLASFTGFPASAPSVPTTFSAAPGPSTLGPPVATTTAPKPLFGASFGAPAFSAPSFGAPALGAPALGSTPAFGFSASSASANPFGSAPNPFAFNSAAPVPGIDKGEEDEGEGEEEPILEPEKVERNPDDTDEILSDVPCKLFRFAKESGEWKDGGKGAFKVTRDASSGQTRMLVRNAMGKIALNASFYKGMTFEAAGDKAIRFAAVCGDDAKLQSLMIKLKPADVPPTLALLERQVAALA